MTTEEEIPLPALVLLVGISSAGKTTFASRWFVDSWCLSSDHYRQVVCDSHDDMDATDDAFQVMAAIAQHRLKRGKPTIVDAMSIRADFRLPFLRIAADHSVPAVAVVFDVPIEECRRRHRRRTDRCFDETLIDDMASKLMKTRLTLPSEGFARIVTLARPESVVVECSASWVRIRVPPSPARDSFESS